MPNSAATRWNGAKEWAAASRICASAFRLRYVCATAFRLRYVCATAFRLRYVCASTFRLSYKTKIGLMVAPDSLSCCASLIWSRR